MPTTGAVHIEAPSANEEYGRAWAYDQEAGLRYELEVKGAAGGNSQRQRTDATTTPTLAATDEVLFLSHTDPRTVATPAAATCKGQVFIIKDTAGTGGAALSAGIVTLDPAGAETIDGATTKTIISTNYGTARVTSTGTAWITL